MRRQAFASRVYARVRKSLRRLRYRMLVIFEGWIKGKRRPRVVFIHTPKTGGNSINSYFKEYVGSKKSGRTVRYDDFIGMNMNFFVEKAKAADYVMGHMPWSAFELCRDERTYAFTILRDPYDRLRSLYHFIVNLPPDYPREDAVNEMQHLSLHEFLSSRDPRVRTHTDNFLTRQFAGALDVLPKTQVERFRLAEVAIRNLSTLDLIGFNDDLDAAFAKVAHVAGLPPPPRGRRVNVTADLVVDGQDRTAASRALDDEARELARPLVEADLLVYEHFRKLQG